MRDKGWENIYRANGNQEQAGIAVTVFDKKDIEYRNIFVAEEESIAILPDRLSWPGVFLVINIFMQHGILAGEYSQSGGRRTHALQSQSPKCMYSCRIQDTSS